MGLFSKLIRESSDQENDVSRPIPKGCVCRECGKRITFITEDMVNGSQLYCNDCTPAYYKKHYTGSGEFEVFLYTMPWNEAILAYAYKQQWLPTYQADTGVSHFPRTIDRDQIPVGCIWANITLAISEHGSFTYRVRGALIAIHKTSGLLCAYVQKEMVY